MDGELQADTALSFEQLKELYPFSRLTDAANVLVFPDLASGNVAYKLMATLGEAAAVGPILLVVGKPIAVLPRNAPVSTIVHMAAFTVCKAQGGFATRATVA